MLIILFLSTLFGNAAARTATPTLHLVNPFHKHCLTHGQPRVRVAFQVMSPLKRSADGLSVLKQKTSLHHAGIDLSFVGSTTTTCQRLISALPPSPTTTSPSLNALACLRGGAVLPLLVLESIPTQSAKTTLALSKVLTACTFITGMFLLTAPVAYTKKMFGISSEVKEDTFESSLLQAIGAIVVGFAIHVYLTLVQTLSNDGMSVVTVGHAMGYSLLPRILIILFSFLQKGKEDYQFKGSNFLKVNFAMMSWTSFSLLTNIGNPNVSTKLFSAMALIKAAALLTKPVKMTKKLFDVDVSGEDMATARILARALGKYLAVSAVLMMSLACGGSPILAAAISFGLWFLLLF